MPKVLGFFFPKKLIIVANMYILYFTSIFPATEEKSQRQKNVV